MTAVRDILAGAAIAAFVLWGVVAAALAVAAIFWPVVLGFAMLLGWRP